MYTTNSLDIMTGAGPSKGYEEGWLFDNLYMMNGSPPCQPSYSSNDDVRTGLIRGTISPYVLGDYEQEGSLYLPKAQAVNITLPPRFLSCDEARKMEDPTAGVHHFVYDYRLSTIWRNPLPCFKRYSHFSCTLGVDFSMFNEQQAIPISVMNLIKNRYMTCAFQQHGLDAIPTFSFGHPALETYWYDGIPEYSQVALCNIIIGKTQAERDLRRYAIEGLVRHKHPTVLIVYGRPLAFDPGVEVRFYEGKLSKIKQTTTK